jgi:hypothetical protein
MESNMIASNVTAQCDVNMAIMLIKLDVEGQSPQNTNIKAIVTGQTLYKKEHKFT